MTSEDFFENIQQHFINELPFAIYRKPNRAEVKAKLQQDDTLYKTTDYTESGFVFAPFNDTDAAILIPTDVSECITLDHFTSIESQLHDKNPIAKPDSNTVFSIDEKTEHTNLVKKGIEAINTQDFQKVVLSRKETIVLSQANPIQIVKQLLKTYATAFVYCWYHPKVGLWLGATPETLLKIQANRFTTMALAGTQKYEGQLDVLWGEKEKQEQQFVTDFIVDSLKNTVKTISTTPAETVKAGELLHLKTTISGTLNLNLKQVLNTLHPTPAVCGLPKTSAKQFILENENYKREFYTGFLGELNIKEKTNRNPKRRNVENSAYGTVKTVSNLFVNLRCMQLKQNMALIYVGGGITKDSIPEDEWQETVNKSQTIKKGLGL